MAIVYIFLGLLFISAFLLAGAFMFLLTYIFELDPAERPSDFNYKGIVDCYKDFRFIERLIVNDWDGASPNYLKLISKAKVCWILSVLFGLTSFFCFFLTAIDEDRLIHTMMKALQ